MNTDDFLIEGARMSERLGIFWPHLLMVMQLESGITPSARNRAGAFGLIQIQNLPKVGWNDGPDAFLTLSDVEQLPYVERFLSDKAKFNLHSVGRIHQSLYVPATLFHPDLFPDSPDTVITARADRADLLPDVNFKTDLIRAYNSNQGFDSQKKGFITVQDLEDTDVRASTSPSTNFQQDIERLRTLIPGLVEGAPVSVPNQGVGGIPWLLVGTLVAVGVGGTMLLGESGVKLPRWVPKWMRA